MSDIEWNKTWALELEIDWNKMWALTAHALQYNATQPSLMVDVRRMVSRSTCSSIYG